MKRRLNSIAVLVVLLLSTTVARSQKITSLTAEAKGQGTITTDLDKKKFSGVVVVLREDATVQISLISDMQLLTEGTWSQSANQTIDLKISGGIVSGNSTGTGKLLLRRDNSIKRLSLRAKSTNNAGVTVEFVANPPAAKP
jgi:hypothetical protein